MKIYKKLKRIFQKYRNIDNFEIDYETAKNIIKNDKTAILLDVRSKQEYKETHIPGSINIPLCELEKNCKILNCDKNNSIIIYCQSGSRSKRAQKLLKEANYKKVYNIKGGLEEM